MLLILGLELLKKQLTPLTFLSGGYFCTKSLTGISLVKISIRLNSNDEIIN